LQWYSSVDSHALTEGILEDEAKTKRMHSEVQAIEKEIHDNIALLGEIAPAIRTLLNPFNWFAKDQRDLRLRHAELHEIGRQKVAQKQAMVKAQEDTRTRMAKLATDLQRHGLFDLSQRQNDLSKIRESIASKKEELKLATERKQRVDEVLAPLIKEMQALESRKLKAKSDLEAAQRFDQRLSSAGNSYDRAKIHEQCERKFSDGSPRRIVVERQREIRQIENDYDKAKRRAEDIGRKAARKIDTIIIDGNNLCYEGSKFIGLSAIRNYGALNFPKPFGHRRLRFCDP